MASVAQPTLVLLLPALSPNPKCGTASVPSRRSSSTMAIRQQRCLSLFRQSPTKRLTGPAQLGLSGRAVAPKKRPRPPLQAINIRALEHGLRVPVCNTPLGTPNLAENIICSLPPLARPLTALPTTVSFPRLDRPASPTTSRPADDSQRAPRRLVRRPRRNSTG
ncbi:hypothetical protein LPJ61_001689 [Coemansia biformis]|uniref:Uncharacterized protein n=1 Tax=Coemansia biformis TaxID=1286918 RepID=A0A9W7YDU9_9FUNG|nr:hypothetical protein LPJ61_001689 [Coemansia biformis]